MEYYAAVKKNKTMLYILLWKEHQNILSKNNKVKKQLAIIVVNHLVMKRKCMCVHVHACMHMHKISGRPPLVKT